MHACRNVGMTLAVAVSEHDAYDTIGVKENRRWLGSTGEKVLADVHV